MSTVNNYRLRIMEASDLATVLDFRNSEKIRSMMYTDQIITMVQQMSWFEKLKQDRSAIYLVFEYDGILSGVVNFVEIDEKNGKCSWGFYLGVENLPKGTGSLMCREGLKFAFEHLKMRKICGQCFAFNIASVKLHEKVGFKKEGLLKKHILKNGTYEDVVIFGLLQEDIQDRGQS